MDAEAYRGKMRSYPASSTFCLALLMGSLLAPAVVAQRRGDCGGATAAGWQATMAPEGEPGELLRVTGRVLGASGAPIAGVHIFAYQTDAEGYYSRGGTEERKARLCGVVQTNEQGEYEFLTIRPGSYPTGGVPQHIHFELWRHGEGRQRMDLEFADDELVPERRRVGLRRDSTVRPAVRGEDGVWRVERDFLLR